jgi:uncharacterized protein (UPF0335 family)
MSATPDWRGYADEIDALEAQLKTLQDAKRDIYGSVRDIHGKDRADALKMAMRIRRTKPEKLERAGVIDGLASEILLAIDKPAPSRVRVARGARKAEVPPHDAETGEIIEDRDGAVTPIVDALAGGATDGTPAQIHEDRGGAAGTHQPAPAPQPVPGGTDKPGKLSDLPVFLDRRGTLQ